jgi:hypothetical protein
VAGSELLGAAGALAIPVAATAAFIIDEVRLDRERGAMDLREDGTVSSEVAAA